MLVITVGATGYLVGQDPSTPDSSRTSTTSAAAASPVTRSVALGEDGEVTVQLDPGAVGPNTVQVTLISPDGGPLQPQETPEVLLSLPAEDIGPVAAEVTLVGEGRYQAEQHLTLPGNWVVEVRVRTSECAQPIASLDVDVQ